MPYFTRLLLLTVISIFLSCYDKKEKHAPISISDGVIESENEIDYKPNKYKLYLGQSKDSILKIIDISRNIEQDNSVNENDSIQHYMTIGEDLIKGVDKDSTGVLPAIYLTFQKGVLKKFECSIIFTPETKSNDSVYKFLRALKPYFGRLNRETNMKTLSKNLWLEFNNTNRDERFEIDTMHTQYDFLFQYKTETKNP